MSAPAPMCFKCSDLASENASLRRELEQARRDFSAMTIERDGWRERVAEAIGHLEGIAAKVKTVLG